MRVGYIQTLVLLTFYFPPIWLSVSNCSFVLFVFLNDPFCFPPATFSAAEKCPADTKAEMCHADVAHMRSRRDNFAPTRKTGSQ